MFSEKALQRVRIIYKKICFIEAIVAEKQSISLALEDEQNARASLLMHLTSIAEQFDKLLHSGELELLAHFDKQDIKGSYEGVDLYIVEDVIDQRVPIIKTAVENILKTEKVKS